MAKSVFPYPGGKSYLAPWAIDHIADHECYVEVFGGSAAVLVNKSPSRVEVFNDLDGDITHFFDVLRESGDELVEWLNDVPYSKELHERWGRKFYDGWRADSDIKRAGVFYFLRRSQYAGKYKTFSGFGSAAVRNKAGQFVDGAEELREYAQRLRTVQVEQRDYQEIFNRFDSEETLFYCDPPYVAEGDALYSHEGGFDHGRFVDCLQQLDGKWLVSYMDLPPGLEEYHTVEREASQHMNKGHDSRRETATERLVMNYDPKSEPMFDAHNQTSFGKENW